jgi:hypothetical protein
MIIKLIKITDTEKTKQYGYKLEPDGNLLILLGNEPVDMSENNNFLFTVEIPDMNIDDFVDLIKYFKTKEKINE